MQISVALCNGIIRLKVHNIKTKPRKDIAEIFTSFDNSDDKLPATIIIEGAPGISKTVLSKEIAFRWANGALLIKKVLVFLIFLIDPVVQNIINLSNLIRYFYQFDENSSDMSKSCADYLIKSEDHNVLFILDGYDELPKTQRAGAHKHFQTSLVHNLIQHRVLPESTVAITSRPHVLGHLRHNADQNVIILGFPEEEQCDFVRCILKYQSEKVSTLLNYLHSHPTVNSLCCIAFNTNMLVCLYRQGLALANNSTELYNHFICNTIFGISLNIT